MQCRALFALVIPCLTLAVSAAPMPAPDSSKGLHILDRALVLEPAELQIARAPEPEAQPGCKMYSCI